MSQPVQFVWGEHDPFGSADVGRRAVELMADAELHVVDTGHGPWFTRPAEVGELVSTFVARRSKAQPSLTTDSVDPTDGEDPA